MLLKILCATLLVLFALQHVQSLHGPHEEDRVAECYLKPNAADDGGVQGKVTFTQKRNSRIVEIKGKITGLSPGKHGWHVHTSGDITDGCTSMGVHFNPYNRNHGGPESRVRHVGDLGNLIANSRGVALIEISDHVISLFNGENYIIGRGLVVHHDPDDLGLGHFPDSNTTGHSGTRVACGVIRLL